MWMADAIVTTLRDFHVSHVFGVSGANIEHIHDAIYRLGGDRLTSVFCKAESGAAFMADGFARESCSLGVCCATSGGGMLNLVAGVAESQAQGVPVLALVGQPPIVQEGLGGFQDSSGKAGTICAKSLWESVTKYSVKLDSANRFWDEFRHCLSQALATRQGAVAMLLPRDVMELEVGARPSDFFDRLEQEIQSESLELKNDKALGQLRALLEKSQSPLVILGESVARGEQKDEIDRFIQTHSVFVASTLGNVAVFPPQHPKYIGSVGVAGHPSTHHYLNEQADLIIAVGTSLEVMTRAPIAAGLKLKKLVVISDAVESFDNSHNADLIIEAEPGKFFQSFNQHFPEILNIEKTFATPKHVPVIERHPSYIKYKNVDGAKNIAQFTDGENSTSLNRSAIKESGAVKVINRFLPRNTHLLFDAGNCAASAAHHINPPVGANASIALGMGGMGYGVAASVGNSLAKKRRAIALGELLAPTVVFCGDGAFLMNGYEVHTAVELDLPILWLVFNNNKHGMCTTRQETYFEDRIESSTFSNEVCISSIAKGLGVDGGLRVWKVKTLNELEGALRQYFSFGFVGPGLIELMVEIDELPPFTPFIEAMSENYMAADQVDALNESVLR